MNFRTPKKLFLVYSFLLFGMSSLLAQSYEQVILIKNTSYSERVKGISPNQIDRPAHGDVSITNMGNGEYDVVYTPDFGYIGLDSAVVEFKTGPAPLGKIFYVSFEFDVRSSVIFPGVDYHRMAKNGGPDTLDVLVNDSSSVGSMSLTDILISSGGSGTLNGTTQVIFEPAQDFTGIAHLNYRVCDSLNTCAIGQIMVAVVDLDSLPARDTIARSVKKNQEIQILLPADSFTVDLTAANGDVTLVGDLLVKYTPDLNFVGTDTFILENPDDLIRDVFITVLPVDQPNSFLLDDEVNTAERYPVTFNVQENDVLGTRYKIKSYTDPDEGVLEPLGGGNFRYTPPVGFSGLKTFTYTVCPSYNNCETAEVRIFVSNSKPENTFNYKFNTLKNVPLVIDYQVPISYFDFNEHLAPVHGAVDIYDGTQTVIVECDTITGNNLVIYYPDTDFHGDDEFELEYTIPQTGYSAIVKVEVSVINADPDSVCTCINGCVWPGDVDNDGRVTVKDLLPLGYFIGYEGPERDSSSTTEWIGHYCDDWTPARNAWQINPKHADTDGNGLVTAQDTQAISQYYYREHNLVEKDISLPREFPLVLTPLFTRLDSGETAVILVGIGTAQDPVYDLSGFTYAYQYDPNIVDSSSVRVEFHDDCWFADQSPILDMYKQPWDGRLDVGFTRTGGKTVTGFGVVSTLSFGVEEDIEGIRKKNNDRTVTVRLDDAYAMNGAGEVFRIKGAELQLKLTGKTEDPDAPADPDKLAVFPNPSEGDVRLFMNGQNFMKNVSVFSLSGQMLGQHWIGRSQKAQIDLGYLHTGLYILRVDTERGPIAKKVQIIR